MQTELEWHRTWRRKMLAAWGALKMRWTIDPGDPARAEVDAIQRLVNEPVRLEAPAPPVSVLRPLLITLVVGAGFFLAAMGAQGCP